MGWTNAYVKSFLPRKRAQNCKTFPFVAHPQNSCPAGELLENFSLKTEIFQCRQIPVERRNAGRWEWIFKCIYVFKYIYLWGAPWPFCLSCLPRFPSSSFTNHLESPSAISARSSTCLGSWWLGIGVGLLLSFPLAGKAQVAVSSLQSRPPSFGEVCFEDFYLHLPWPEEAQLRKLLLPAEGVPSRMEPTHWHGQRCYRLTGLWRLVPPWQPGSAVGFWLVETENRPIQIHLWAGQKGATFQYCSNFHQTWAAFTTRRTGTQPQPDSLEFWTTDQGRYRRTGIGSLTLYWQDGRLILARGDLPLISLPFPDPPQELYLHTRALVRGIRMLRVADGPPKETWPVDRSLVPSPPILIDLPRLAWQIGLQERVRFRVLEDGTVEWWAEARSGDVQTMASVVPAGMYQWTFQVDTPQPGTGILWANARGEVQARLSFFRDRTTGRTTFALVPGWHREIDRQYDPRRPIPWIEGPRWFRLVHGAGVVKLFTSPDGRLWTQTEPEELRIPEPLTQIGLFCWDGPQPRYVRLRRLSVQRLELLESLVPGELLQKVAQTVQTMDPNAADSPWKAANLQEWEKRILACRPLEIRPEQWKRAWMVYILGVGPIPGWGPQLLYPLVQQAMEQAHSLEEGLRFLEEVALFFPAASDWQAAERWAGCYDRLARRAEDFGTGGVYPLLWRSFVLAPFWPQRDWPPVLERLVWYELIRAMSADRLAEAADLCQRLRFRCRPEWLYHRQVPWNPQTEHLIRLVEQRCARRRLPVAPDRPLLEQIDDRPLLLEQWAREAYNVKTEWEAALANGQLREACVVLQGVTRAALEGLLPDGQDPQLLLSLRAVAAQAMEQSAELRRVMQEEFGPRAQIRLQQAIEAGNPEDVQMITIQFAGTKAALQAHRWLGDRALAAGRFAQAAGHYRQALQQADPQESDQFRARLQLALALQGKAVSNKPLPGQPSQLLLFGGSAGQMEAGVRAVKNFSQLLEDLVRVRSAWQSSTPAGGSNRCPPAPTGQTEPLQVRQVLVAEGGSKKPDFVSAGELDWAGRETSALLADPMLIITSRCEHLAFDLSAGRTLWRHWRHLPSAARPWPLLATPPVGIKDMVLLRRAIDGIHELAALDRLSGRLLWSTAGDDYIASDPLWADQAIWVFTVRTIEGQKNILSLLRLDPGTGRIHRRFPLLEFRSHSEPVVWCQAAVQDDRIVATAAGVVFCCDLCGRLAWVRRQTWLPPPGRGMYEARCWLVQKPSPPILQDRWVYATQPAVWNIECIDLQTGRLQWRSCLSELVGLVGLLEGKLIAMTTEGLVAFDAKNGRVLWRHETPGRQEAVLCGPPGGLVYARLNPPADPNRQQPKVLLVWLDLEQGIPLGEYPVDLPAESKPLVSPLVSDGRRLWLFFGKADNSASRTVFEVLLRSETARKDTSNPSGK